MILVTPNDQHRHIYDGEGSMSQDEIEARLKTLQGRYDRNKVFVECNPWLSIMFLSRMRRLQDDLYVEMFRLQDEWMDLPK